MEQDDIALAIKRAVTAERARCAAWAQRFRENGESDMRSMIWAINSGSEPDEDEDDDGYG